MFVEGLEPQSDLGLALDFPSWVIQESRGCHIQDQELVTFPVRSPASSTRPGLGTSEAQVSLEYKPWVSFVKKYKTPRRAAGK